MEFEYSVEARNVLNKFYGVDRVVYVEGEYDIPFWEIIFEKILSVSVEFESVGGKPELKKYAEKILSGEAEYVVAMDSDYDYFFDIEENPQIIRTFGYSIENSIITFESLCKALKNITRIPAKSVPSDVCRSWILEFEEKTKDLVLLDLFNARKQLGISVIPDSTERFMTSNNSCNICDRKVSKFIGKIGIRKEDCKEEEDALRESGRSVFELLRGHFLFSAIMRFIKVQAKKLGKNISMSKDMMYSVLVAVFEIIFTEDHSHYSYYKKHLEVLDVNA